jgi:hypothetical protein
MSHIVFKIGRLRLRIGRVFDGGMCPLNVVRDQWNIVPEARRRDRKKAGSIDISPGHVGSLLLQKILTLLRNRNRHDRIL